MPRSPSDPGIRNAHAARPAPAPARPIGRRRALAVAAAWGATALAAALLAGCDKPYFDRDRGVFVFQRHDR